MTTNPKLTAALTTIAILAPAAASAQARSAWKPVRAASQVTTTQPARYWSPRHAKPAIKLQRDRHW